MNALKQLYCPGCHEFHVNCRCSQIVTTTNTTDAPAGDGSLDPLVGYTGRTMKAPHNDAR